MTSSIPNSFSRDDLERMLENAQSEQEVDNSRNYDKDYMIQLASDICDEMMERSYGPLIHKIVALTILNRLESWHTGVSAERMSEDDPSGIGWSKHAVLSVSRTTTLPVLAGSWMLASASLPGCSSKPWTWAAMTSLAVTSTEDN